MCDLLNWKWLVFLREVSKLIRFICHFNRWALSSCGFSPFLSPVRPFEVFLLDICRYRHLMMDVMSLLPHSKKDVKVQGKDNKAATLNELADLKSCSSCLLFEVTPFYTFWPAGSKDGDVLKDVSVVWIVLEMSPGFCWGRVFVLSKIAVGSVTMKWRGAFYFDTCTQMFLQVWHSMIKANRQPWNLVTSMDHSGNGMIHWTLQF